MEEGCCLENVVSVVVEKISPFCLVCPVFFYFSFLFGTKCWEFDVFMSLKGEDGVGGKRAVSTAYSI